MNGDSFSFMKNSCGDVKFVVIELSQRVKLTSLEISMVELYSSRARTIDLYSTLTKPTKAVESPWLVGDWAYHATVRVENKKGDHVRSISPILPKCMSADEENNLPSSQLACGDTLVLLSSSLIHSCQYCTQDL